MAIINYHLVCLHIFSCPNHWQFGFISACETCPRSVSIGALYSKWQYAVLNTGRWIKNMDTSRTDKPQLPMIHLQLCLRHLTIYIAEVYTLLYAMHNQGRWSLEHHVVRCLAYFLNNTHLLVYVLVVVVWECYSNKGENC